MVLGRRRRAFGGAAVASVAAILVVVAMVVTKPEPGPEPAPPAPQPAGEAPEAAAPATSSTVPAEGAPAPGRGALVTVAAATVWREPGRARPVDGPSLSNPVDLARWIAAMSHEDKLWLVDHLVTQALYGERVVVQELRGDWARVVVTGQPSQLDPRGYPGWVPTVQLRAGEPVATRTSAVVVRPLASLRDADDPSRLLLGVSFNTRLPVLEIGATEVTVALPTGGRGVLAKGLVEVTDPGPSRATGADLVRSAQLFSGLPYLWAGTSVAGFDCSGLTAAVFGAHGIVLPRDADDQAGVGTPVERSALQPGDLLFFSSGPDQRSIHHVSMYVGNGMMIQSPATGKTVETVPLDTPQYARQYWGARRYLPAASP